MPFAQVQGENTIFDDLDTFEDISLEFEIGGITDQPRVTVDDDLANVFLFTHQQTHLPAMLTRLLVSRSAASW